MRTGRKGKDNEKGIKERRNKYRRKRKVVNGKIALNRKQITANRRLEFCTPDRNYSASLFLSFQVHVSQQRPGYRMLSVVVYSSLFTHVSSLGNSINSTASHKPNIIAFHAPVLRINLSCKLSTSRPEQTSFNRKEGQRRINWMWKLRSRRPA